MRHPSRGTPRPPRLPGLEALARVRECPGRFLCTGASRCGFGFLCVLCIRCAIPVRGSEKRAENTENQTRGSAPAVRETVVSNADRWKIVCRAPPPVAKIVQSKVAGISAPVSSCPTLVSAPLFRMDSVAQKPLLNSTHGLTFAEGVRFGQASSLLPGVSRGPEPRGRAVPLRRYEHEPG